jgi:hypothetical protein
MMLLAALGFALAVPAAHAGKCDAALAKANGSADEALAPAFTALAACDAELAAVTFKAFALRLSLRLPSSNRGRRLKVSKR